MTPKISDSPYQDHGREELMPFLPATTKNVLEVGCHTGYFGRAIKKKYGATVWGIEPNKKTARIAAEGLDRVFEAYFDETLDLPDQYFDVITFTDVLEHMPDPWAALKIASTKLSKGGIVLISVPNIRHIDNLVHLLRDRDFKYEPLGIRDKTHLRFFTKKSAPRLFEGTGLQMTKIVGINEIGTDYSLSRRLVFSIFSKYMEDTRYVQYAMIGELDKS